MESDERGPATAGARVLVVEDEPHIRDLIALHLSLEGLKPVAVGDGDEGLRLARAEPFDLVVLDLMLPGLDGVTVCRAIRRDTTNSDVPILMLTARREESDKVLGLESGADDYLTKPFGVREFVARVRALLRRPRPSRLGPAIGDDAQAGGGEGPDRRSRAPARAHRRQGDRADESRVRHALPAREPSRASCSAGKRSSNASGATTRIVTERSVDTLIKRLRRKIEAEANDPQLILTVWGTGYKFSDA